MARLTDEELIASIESEEALALDAVTSSLANDRAEALARYKGDPLGNEVAGRSHVVDMSVADTIEWIMPSLMRIYLGGDEIGKFEPRGPEDEKAAEAETDVCNWYLNAKNDAYTQIHATLKDALLLRNGYLVAYWKTDESVITETYKGLADEEAALLLKDDDVEVVEHSEYPDPCPTYAMTGALGPDGNPQPQPQSGMLHDIRVDRKKAEEYVAVESVPPEEVLVSRRHRWTSLLDSDFIQWRRRITIGELRSEGFDVADDEPGYEDFAPEGVTRARFQESRLIQDETADPSRRVVVFKNTLMRIDLRGSGKAQLWRVCHLSGSNKVLLKEEINIVNIAAFTGMIYPHSHIGMSVYDAINDLALIKTMLKRQLIDNVFLVNNTQSVVDVTRVNMDDWLISAPGIAKRVEGPVTDAWAPIVTPDVSSGILQAIEFIDSEKEARTGVTKYSAGLDANSLNKTATGVQQIQAAANQRIELIARTLATGFRDLFLIIHALACQHSTKPLQIKLGNQWTVVNPREWTRRTDFTISVGLGTGTPEQQIQKLMMMAPFLQQGAQMGLVGPDEFHNWATEVLKAMGYKSPDKFVREPQKDPRTGQTIPPPQQPNPLVQAEQEKGKVSLAIAQMKAQQEGQQAAARAQADAAVEQARMQADVAIQNNKRQSDFELELAKAKMQLELDAAKHSREQETAIRKQEIATAGQIEVARVNAGISDGGALTAALERAAGMIMDTFQNAVGPALEQMRNSAQTIALAASTPKRIVRNPRTGRAEGVVPDNGPTAVQ